MNYKFVPKKEINIDKRFLYSFSFDNDVKGSLIFPLFVYQKENNLILIDGFKRYQQFEYNFPVLQISDKEYSDDKAFIFSINANLSFRKLNIIEKAKISMLVSLYFNSTEDEIIKILGIGKRDFHKLKDLLLLDESFKRKLAKWDFPKKNALLMSDNPNNWNIIWNDLKSLNISASQFRKILTVVNELSKRKRILPTKIWEDMKNQLKKHQLKLDINSINLILNIIQHPISTKMEDIKKTIIKDLELPENIVFNFPVNFEGEYLDINLKINSPKELKIIIEQLNKISDKKSFNKIFSDLL